MSDNLASILQSIETSISDGQFSEAAILCEEAVSLDPNCTTAFYNHGFILYSQGRHEEAIPYFRKSLQCDPDYEKASRGLLLTLVTTGKHDEAHKQCIEMLNKNPNDQIAYHNLVSCKKYTSQDDEDIRLLEKALTMPELTNDAKIAALFSLGKAYSDTNEYDKAFTACDEANRLFAQDNPFNTGHILEDFAESSCAFFDSEFFVTRKDWGSDSKMPIFIVGMPRSGTTLVEQILARHPKIITRGELNLAQTFASSAQKNLNSSISYPDCLISANKEFIEEMAELYLQILSANTDAAEYVIDKMPHNFWYLGFISLLFPNARIIHCTRDPMDIGLSLYFHRFTHENEYSYSLEGVAAYYKLYEKMMGHWKQVLPVKIFDVSYESLVEDFANVCHGIVEYCGVGWDDACLSPHQTQAAVETASAWQVRQPVYKSSVGRWKNYEKHLAPLKKALEEG